jgi:hypothetical protein
LRFGMALESLTKTLLARADEVRDPGSGVAYLRLTSVGEATLKLSPIRLLSEAVYRDGSKLAKKAIADTVAGRSLGWASVFEISGRLAPDLKIARRISTPPARVDERHDLWTRSKMS